MDFSRLQRTELIALIGSALLVISLFVPWFSLTDTPERLTQLAQGGDPFVCGEKDLTCTAWETFPINRIVFLLAAAAPVILTYLILTASKGQYPTGEFTMTVGFAVIVLVFFNGIVAKPGGDPQFGISLDYGYFIALLSGFLIAGAGAFRSLESGGGAQRKPPATF
ncbi:MAG: hypothetical protein AABM29_04290 [Actinomycetota bacterium]